MSLERKNRSPRFRRKTLGPEKAFQLPQLSCKEIKPTPQLPSHCLARPPCLLVPFGKAAILSFDAPPTSHRTQWLDDSNPAPAIPCGHSHVDALLPHSA